VFVDGGATVGEHRIDALPTSAAPRSWRVRALDGDALIAGLDRLGVEHDVPTPTGVDVLLADDDAAADLLGRLVAGGVRVVEMHPHGGALEATYLELTEERR